MVINYINTNTTRTHLVPPALLKALHHQVLPLPQLKLLHVIVMIVHHLQVFLDRRRSNATMMKKTSATGS